MTTIRAGYDAVAKAARPDYEFGAPRKLRAENGVSTSALRFPLRPAVPRGAVVTGARLKVRTAVAPAAGTYQLNAQRFSSAWDARTHNWNNRPAVAGSAVAASVVNPAEGSVFTWDVLPDVLQFLASGGNFGWRISAQATNPGQLVFWGLSAEQLKPTLEVDWALAPDEPTDLNPAAGAVSLAQPTLEWAADDSFIAYQVQVHTANSFTAPVYDSGEVAGTDPVHSLAGTALSLTAGSNYWWRVRIKNGAGWSDWSSVAKTWRTLKPTVVITNPGASSTDPTPLITWTVSGGVGGQKNWRVFVENSQGEEVDDSGPRTSDATRSWLPQRGARTDGEQYTVELRVWDGETRDGTPGDAAFTRVRQTYTFDRGAPPAPSSLLLTQESNAAPWVDLTWVRADRPDGGWLIERNTDSRGWRRIARTTMLEIPENPTDTYKWRDWTADPNHQHKYRVSPIVNGVVGAASVQATITSTVKGVWLGFPEGGIDALILGRDEVDAAMQEAGEVLYALGRGSAIILTTELRGLEGQVAGYIAPTPYGRTFQQESDAMEFFRENPGIRDPDDEQRSGVRLCWADANIPVGLRALSLSPRRVGTFPGRINRTVSFEFFQDGELPGAVT